MRHALLAALTLLLLGCTPISRTFVVTCGSIKSTVIASYADTAADGCITLYTTSNAYAAKFCGCSVTLEASR